MLFNEIQFREALYREYICQVWAERRKFIILEFVYERNLSSKRTGQV